MSEWISNHPNEAPKKDFGDPMTLDAYGRLDARAGCLLSSRRGPRRQ